MTAVRKSERSDGDMGGLSLAILIYVDKSFDNSTEEKLESILRIFKKRFDASITLGFEDFEPLGLLVLSRWLASELIDQTICSGSQGLVLNDLVGAAIRSTAAASIFITAVDALRSPARVLKFIVENLGTSDGVVSDELNRFLQIGKSDLLKVPRRRLSGLWSEDIQRLCEVCDAEGKDLSRPLGSDLAPSHLFVSASGVRRLGGMPRFRELQMHIGGVPVSMYRKISVLDLEDSVTGEEAFGGGRHIKAVHQEVIEDKTVIFDIWPAPYELTGYSSSSCENKGSYIDVPRQILVGRRCPVSKDDLMQRLEHKAVFIMSNFNKSRYVHAALYGCAMQVHPNVKLEVIDDISTDDSLEKIHNFQHITRLNNSFFDLSKNEKNSGTYWIRNLIISRNLSDNVVFFINDSDDVSSALRSTLQLAALANGTGREACLFNIVRVDKNYVPLPLNGEVERYGTATLSFWPDLIKKVGYFQNIKRNADTEFIRRVTRFLGKSVLPWLRLPVMFQPFDGDNLTADVYQMKQDGSISANLSLRRRHIEIADKHYESLVLEDLPDVFSYPEGVLAPEYLELGSDFLAEIDTRGLDESGKDMGGAIKGDWESAEQ